MAAALLLLRPDTGAPGTANGGQPVMKEVTVPVDQAWTETGVFCAANGTINIKASGQATYDETEAPVGPDGLTSGEHFESRVYRDAGTASLIGSLDTYSERVLRRLCGQVRVSGRRLRLLLGINDNDLAGNRGEFSAAVTYTPPQ